MKVSFELRRLAAPQSVNAMLVLSDHVADVLPLCARFGTDPLPLVYRLAGAFLLKLDGPADASRRPGAIALHALADHLYVPADARLAPTLQEDERRGLVRDRGLVFLPGGRVLAFDPRQPLALSQLLSGGAVRRQAWTSLPEPRPRSERIRSIQVDRPDETPDTILEVGGGDVGTEDPRPRDAGLPAKILGQAALAAGQTLLNLGNLLGLKGLANLGAQWMKQALELAPRLGESLLGRQEAALRELLRQFREGKLEDALRRALPLGGGSGRGATTYTGQELPTHSTAYSLSDVLGSGGTASIWYGGQDLHAELSKEYRRAAEEAIRKGDFRRAAFIYGKLLNDFRMAANVLLQGCLFHDAALIYLTKLDDRRAAARAFDSAGEIDRAVELYRALGEHVLAGDVLLRAGEEEQAVLEYRIAAERLASTGDYLRAGDLMLTRAQRPDSAREFFQMGWERRPDATAVACGVRLARTEARQGAIAPLQTLVGEAREYFARPGDEAGAEQFFNELAQLAGHAQLGTIRDELRDHALVGLAIKLRQRTAVETRPGNATSKLYGRPGLWPAATLSDADHAFRAAFRVAERETAPRPSGRVRLGVGLVTAVCHAPASGDVFVGFLSGDVIGYRPATGETIAVKTGDGMHVRSLATSAHGEMLCVLQTNGHVRLRSYRRGAAGIYRMVDHSEEVVERERPWVGEPDDTWLTPLLAGDDYTFGMLESDELVIRQVISNRRDRPVIHLPSSKLDAALLLPSHHESRFGTGLLLFHSSAVVCYPLLEPEQYPVSASLGWTPSRSGSSLLVPLLAWLLHGHDLDLTGLDPEGVLSWSRLHFSEGRLEVVARTTSSAGYLATTMVRPSLVAGVARDRIDWLRAGATSFTIQSRTPIALSDAVACFSSALTAELLVISQDGTLERVPVPIG